MQVACNSCGAVYEFDVAAIPSEGYDAQCTSCNSVFFVKPETGGEALAAEEVPPSPPAEQPVSSVAAPGPPVIEPPAPPDVPEATLPAGQITVTCKGCNAAYQFAPTDIPAEGYDAQCTQCQSVFFVSPQGDGHLPGPTQPTEPLVAEPTEPVEAEPVEAEPVEAEPVEAEPVEAEPMEAEPVEAEPMEAEPMEAEPMEAEPMVPMAVPTSDPDAALLPPAQGALDGATAFAPQGEVSDLLALDDDLGEPDHIPDGVSMEEDFEKIVQRKRRNRLIALGSLAGVAVLLAAVYFALPGVWDTTIGPLVGIKARIHPEAIPLKEAGFEKMLEDTAEGYAEAEKQLTAALELDPLYPDAIALAILVHTFRGKDIQERGRALRLRGEKIIQELAALQAARGRSKDSKARTEKLRTRAEKINEEASELYQQGGDELRKAERYVSTGIKKFRSSAAVITASGIYLSTDSDRAIKADEYLKASLKLLGVEQLDLLEPPNHWMPFLRGMIDASNSSDQDSAEQAFRAAIEREPRLLRADYELARVLVAAKKTADAKVAVKALLERSPEHPKGKRLLGDIGAAMAAAAKAEQVKSKSSKGRKRKRRR